jgi:hypothetical protein
MTIISILIKYNDNYKYGSLKTFVKNLGKMSKVTVSVVGVYGFYSSSCGYCDSKTDDSSRFGMRAIMLNCKVIFRVNVVIISLIR